MLSTTGLLLRRAVPLLLIAALAGVGGTVPTADPASASPDPESASARGAMPATAPPGTMQAGHAAGVTPVVRLNGTRVRPLAAVAPPPRPRARSWAVADLDSGRLLGARRASTRLPMASTIKLLTALTALRTVPAFPAHRVTRAEAHPEYCSCAGLKVGRMYTRRTLLAGILLASGNDAAEALAGSHPQGRAAFVSAMNQVAVELGATGTRAANPSGLTAGNAHSSARDVLILLREALAKPALRRILAMESFEFGPRRGKKHTIRRKTDYVNRYDDRWPGTLGKSGFTTPAKNTLVVSTPLRGRRIGVAILGAAPGTITESARKLTLWAVRNFANLGPVGRLPQ